MQFLYDHDRLILRADDDNPEEQRRLKDFVKTVKALSLNRPDGGIHSIYLGCDNCGSTMGLFLGADLDQTLMVHAVLNEVFSGDCQETED